MKKVFIGIIALSLLSPLTVYANAGYTKWAGRPGYDVIITDKTCPVSVEKEVLTLDIDSLPSGRYNEKDELAGYTATATAQYTFRNTAGYDINATLVFPFNNIPDYINIYDSDYPKEISPDSDRYSVTCDSQPVEKEIRYTFSAGDFDTATETDKIKDSYRQDQFFSPETPVTKYIYRAQNIGSENSNSGKISLRWENKTGKTLLCFPDSTFYQSLGQNIATTGRYAIDGEDIVIYTIGEKLRQPPELKPYSTLLTPDATVTLITAYEMTFEQFIFNEWEVYDENIGINKIDWFNIFIDCFNHFTIKEMMILDEFSARYHLITDYITAWFKYDISFPAGDTVINTVTAPLYPSIDRSYNPPVYGYTYYLSPAATWSDFGNIDIIINTPFYITESSVPLEKTESGYLYTQKGMPQGELSFTLCSKEHTAKISNPYMGHTFYIVLAFAVEMLFICCGVYLISKVICKIFSK